MERSDKTTGGKACNRYADDSFSPGYRFSRDRLSRGMYRKEAFVRSRLINSSFPENLHLSHDVLDDTVEWLLNVEQRYEVYA